MRTALRTESWATPRLDLGGCVLYVPLWHPTLGSQVSGSTFQSKDKIGHICTVTGALWTPQGRTFDGFDDSIEVSDTPSLDIIDAITIGGWVKPGLANTEQYWIAKGDRGIAINYVASITATNYFAFEFYTTPTWYTNADDTTPLVVGTWYHLVATYDKVNVKLYIQGVLAKTIPRTPVLTANALSLFIGREGSAGGTFFTGTQGEVLAYNRALFALEIQRNYLATKWRYS